MRTRANSITGRIELLPHNVHAMWVFAYVGALSPADARARRADVRHDHAGEAGGVEARGDNVRPQLSIIRNSIWAYSLPERIALHFVRSETHVVPALGTL